MKKTFLFGIVAAMLATACTEEESFNQIASGEGITFTSSVASRATDNSFETGDEIGISMYANGAFASSATNVKYTTVDGTTFTGAEITWEAAGGASSADFIGVYPYKDGSISSTTYSFTISNEDGATLSGNDVMYARSSGITTGENTVSLAFEHKLVKVVMKVYNGSTSLTTASVEIDKQQLTGTMDLLNEGTVTATGDATGTMSFKFNSKDSQYEAIVMPSDAVEGRAITITSDGKTYSCPVGDLAFASGTKMTLSATLNVDETTLGDGKVKLETISVSDWKDGVDKDWYFEESTQIEMEGKTSYQLATDVDLTSEGNVIGGFEGELAAKDAYCLSYTINEQATLSSRADGKYSITVAPIEGEGSTKVYTLSTEHGLSGQLLIAVGENTKGIKVSGTEGITLNEVLVYTSATITLPEVYELWSGDSGEPNPYWPTVEFDIEESYRADLSVGATLRIEYVNSTGDSQEIRYNFGSNNDNVAGPTLYNSGYFVGNNAEGVITAIVTLPLLEAIEANNYHFALTLNNMTISRISLIPVAGEVSPNLLWKGYAELGGWPPINVALPSNMVVGDKIRIYFENGYDGLSYNGWRRTYGTETIECELFNVTADVEDLTNGYVDFEVTEATVGETGKTILEHISEMLQAGGELQISGSATVTEVEYIPVSEQ